ncbi:hypothetical protein Adt_11020 [Abeliophyllum distichum]|uniref:Uncharacterized protein n=1 Tax=Abeliophyllum distichum TaxID=126358 RepID=A0ABD1ULY5_9LAMI
MLFVVLIVQFRTLCTLWPTEVDIAQPYVSMMTLFEDATDELFNQISRDWIGVGDDALAEVYGQVGKSGRELGGLEVGNDEDRQPALDNKNQRMDRDNHLHRRFISTLHRIAY